MRNLTTKIFKPNYQRPSNHSVLLSRSGWYILNISEYDSILADLIALKNRCDRLFLDARRMSENLRLNEKFL